MVHFARTSGYPAFDAKDLANLSALCHPSAQRALRVRSKRLTSEWATRLTARELNCGISGERIDEYGDWDRTLDHTKFRETSSSECSESSMSLHAQSWSPDFYR